ncbi:transcription initiation factor IIF subunit alpha isoform X1 [Tripterygium wilfordii]|uniref:transcription initiation factor IIF subunit alpha isoform X1 n=1 Tax=Tripterygium wilfordii TaxID=458696 RepID=UPI0018F80DF2|nr:transcription initiation factor IIF subunit alpha isoform X1 [Tripterygium wilfordii]
MSFDLQLKPSCSGCGSNSDLYGSNCKHMTLCLTCGKTMAENRGKCYECGTTITRLIREYNVRASPSSDKNFFIGRFVSGLPNFSKKKNAENKWSLQKEGLQGRQLTDALREKYKNKPWLLEDETGLSQYQGQLEGAQSATYYLLMMQGKEFSAIPAGSWYNFNKVAQYKQLTLEEAEEKMKNRKKTADGYQRWIMKAATNGAAAFGEVEKLNDEENDSGGGRGRKKKAGDDDEGNVSDRGEEDEEEEAERNNRLGLNRRGGDDDEEGRRGGDHDLDDDDIEKGDDWEHEETFTDDDEAVGNDPEEREDLAPDLPAPPEIKEDEDEEDEENGETKLSISGKELKKLLGRTAGLNDSDVEEDDDDDDMEDEGFSPVQAPKQKDALKEEPTDSSPSKPAPSGSARGTPSSKSAKTKRKSNGDDVKAPNGAPPKKIKTENELKSSAKNESLPASKSGVPPKGATAPPQSSSKVGSTSSTEPVTEDEIRAVLMQKTPVTTQDLVAKFRTRLKSIEQDKRAFADILKRISRIHKTNNGSGYIVLKDK